MDNKREKNFRSIQKAHQWPNGSFRKRGKKSKKLWRTGQTKRIHWLTNTQADENPVSEQWRIQRPGEKTNQTKTRSETEDRDLDYIKFLKHRREVKGIPRTVRKVVTIFRGKKQWRLYATWMLNTAWQHYYFSIGSSISNSLQQGPQNFPTPLK